MEEKKVVLITGGAMGQGRAHAYKYAENGFNVVLADMLEPSHEAFKETIANCEAKGAKVLAKKANITSTEDMEALFASAWETFGRLDVVIANAGVINFGYTWELTDEQVEKVMDIPYTSSWRLSWLLLFNSAAGSRQRVRPLCRRPYARHWGSAMGVRSPSWSTSRASASVAWRWTKPIR